MEYCMVLISVFLCVRTCMHGVIVWGCTNNCSLNVANDALLHVGVPYCSAIYGSLQATFTQCACFKSTTVAQWRTSVDICSRP